MLILANRLNSSPARCDAPRTPLDAKVSLPGFAFASAIKSRTECTGSDGCTTRTYDALPTRLIGAKSLIASYATVVEAAGIMALGAELPSNSVYPSAGDF